MRFRLTVLDAGRAVAIHEMDAVDEGDARRQALARGLRVLAIDAGSRFRRRGRARLALVPFSNELVALLEAGLSLVEAIDALTEKERDEAVRNVLEGIRRRLYEGQNLSVALGEFPSSFPALFVATVRASEKTGAIAEAIRRFVAYQEQIDQLKKKLINASIYPAVLLGAARWWCCSWSATWSRASAASTRTSAASCRSPRDVDRLYRLPRARGAGRAASP
jgi:general secretion pathway protein F